jgi:hypothetical protein
MKRGMTRRNQLRGKQTETLKKLWRPKKGEANHVRIRLQNWNNDKLNGKQVREFLDLAFAVTGDPVFETAGMAMDAYELEAGPTKRVLVRLCDYFAPRESHFYSAQMAAYIREGLSERAAAERVVSELGAVGQSFDAAVDEMRKYYATSHDRQPPSGDTDRRLVIRPAASAKAFAANPEFKLDTDGFARVPDNRFWRQQVAAGFVSQHGTLGRE